LKLSPVNEYALIVAASDQRCTIIVVTMAD